MPRPASKWTGNVPNAKRQAKMRTLTLSDVAWEKLGRLAGGDGKRSAYVESWLQNLQESEPGAPLKKRSRGS